jgi:hypothetical protein
MVSQTFRVASQSGGGVVEPSEPVPKLGILFCAVLARVETIAKPLARAVPRLRHSVARVVENFPGPSHGKACFAAPHARGDYYESVADVAKPSLFCRVLVRVRRGVRKSPRAGHGGAS